MDGSFSAEIYIVATDGSGSPVNISRTRDLEQRRDVERQERENRVRRPARGSYAMQVVSLQKPVADGSSKPPSDQIDWEDLHRESNAPPAQVREYARMPPDGFQVAFRSLSNGDDLWVANTNGSSGHPPDDG